MAETAADAPLADAALTALVQRLAVVQPDSMDIFHALIERSGPDDIHDRVSIEAASLAEAKRLLEQQYGAGKVFGLYGERESSRLR